MSRPRRFLALPSALALLGLVAASPPAAAESVIPGVCVEWNDQDLAGIADARAKGDARDHSDVRRRVQRGALAESR